MTDAEVPTPKDSPSVRTGQAAFYPYYAGFSSSFAKAMLQALAAHSPGIAFDPWNGAGTTTAACAELGLSAIGSDLNPVMVVIAKARLLAPRTVGSIEPLTAKIVHSARSQLASDFDDTDPLCDWFACDSARQLRTIERALFATLVSSNNNALSSSLTQIVQASDLASFFYLGLFNLVRGLLAPRRASNPTWMRRPKNGQDIVAVEPAEVVDSFLREMRALTDSLLASAVKPRADNQRIDIALADSRSSPLKDGSVGSVLTSPPYCTRIDYAVATAGELAVLGIGTRTDFSRVRRSLIGTAAVDPTGPEQSLLWGPECLKFLDKLYAHPSAASKSYYYKSHCQYFDSLYRSIGEISRVLMRGGYAALVVQNSHYKEILNDLPQICIEMGETFGLGLSASHSFPVRNSFSKLNASSKKYVDAASRREWEEVVILRKH